MIKLYKARSLLYRRQILQENIRWKALDEIYKIHMLLHRSDFNVSEIVRQFFSHFWQTFAKIRYKARGMLSTDCKNQSLRDRVDYRFDCRLQSSEFREPDFFL